MSKIERIKCGNGNVYLVYDGDNAILVDTCREQFRDVILERCKTKNIRLIVLTHGHVDHVQNAAYLSKELDVPIAMHKGDYDLIKDNRLEPMSANKPLGKIILKLSQKSFERDKIDQFEAPIFLSDGDTLNEYGIDGKIIGLHGHTKGSIGIIVGKADVIVGDALMNMIRPTKSLLYGDKTVMERSAARISSLGDVTIHFGHGKPVKNRDW